jgi:predicted Zn-dependent protease
MTDPRTAADRLVEIIGSRGEAEATVAVGRLELTRFANSFIHQNVGEEYVHVRLRVAAAGRVASVSGNRADDDALKKLAEDALIVAATQPVDEDWPGLTAAVSIAPSDFSHASTNGATPGGRAAAVKAFVDAGNGLSAAGFCDTDSFEAAFANSQGHRASSRGSRATIDGIHQTGESAGAAHQTSNAFADLDGAAAGALAADRARRGMHAFDLKPGEYEVVLAPEPVATIAVFLDFYGFNGKAFNEGQSFVELGTGQFDERVTMIDDPMGPGALGEAYDAEGTPKQPTTLIDHGITKTVVHDRRSGRRAGAGSTGHAWAMSGSLGPLAGHVVVQPGTDTVADMIAAVERGVYVATFNYCRILDPKSQVVTGLTRNGTFMIENGAITGAVTNLRFTQSFVKAFGPGNVLGVGNDLRYADSEFGQGVVRAPSLRLASWNFTGGAAG